MSGPETTVTRPPASAATTAVRVVLVDDTPDFRLLLAAALDVAGGFVVVGEAGDGATAVDVVRAAQPDVVLLDLAMPVMDGIAAMPLLRAVAPDAAIIVLSGFDSAHMSRSAMAAGASAYLQKGAPVRTIVGCIREVLGGAGSDDAQVAPPPSETRASEIERLRQALATAAHELRSPVTVLAGLTALLRDHGDDLAAPATRQLLEAVARQAAVLDRVTGDLLTSAQAERGTVSVSTAPVALAPVLHAATAGHPDVVLDCPADVVVVADEVRVVQMVGNLLTNSAKYGAPPVHVSVSTVASRAEIRVRDAGRGIPEAFRSRMFDQYTRGADAPASGTGIGLFVVRTLALAQGGSIRYEPPSTGGAGFVVELPLAGVDVAG